MKQVWDDGELAENWNLKADEEILFKGKSAHAQLGIALQLKHYQAYGRFPKKTSDFALQIIRHVSDQLGIVSEGISSYDWEARSARRHRQEILKFLDIRRITARDRQQLITWLCNDVFSEGTEPNEAFDQACSYLLDRKLQCPSTKELDRLIRSAHNRFLQSVHRDISARLSGATREAIEVSLADPDVPIGFNGLKADPGRVSLDNILRTCSQLRFIRSLRLSTATFGGVSAKFLKRLKQMASNDTAWDMKQRPIERRHSLCSIHYCFRGREITDGLIDLLLETIHKIDASAQRKVMKELMADFQKVYGKERLLFEIADAALTDPDGAVCDVVFPVANPEVLSNLVKEYKSSGPGYKKKVHTVLRASYGNHYRKMLPAILDVLEFRSNNAAHRPLLDALDWIKRMRADNRRFIQLDEGLPVDGVVPKKWHEVIIDHDATNGPRINRINYEICALQTLRERIRCKEIWVVGADRYRNPDEDLPGDFEDRRPDYYGLLDQPMDAGEFIARVKKDMDRTLFELNAGMPRNKKVSLRTNHKNRICLSPLEPQPEAQGIAPIKAELAKRWPMTGLLDVLKEADLRIGFSDLFQTSGNREILDRETIQRRLLLCLYAMGTNAGLKRISAGPHGVSYKELLHIRRRFIGKDALRNAIGQIANAVFAVRNPEIWGEGTTSCASDSKKFGAWDQNLMTEWHIRYGGRGVMIYWHVEKKSTCIYSQLKRCSSSEVASMIEGVLKHCTDMDVDRQYVDSHGQSEVAFAFCHMLGFDLLPRLKAISRQKLYLPDPGKRQNYGNLEPILTRPIDWRLIEQQYDEIVKFAAAMKLGTADPEAILRRFTRSNVQHPTYKALTELGKAIKTIFLARYLGSEELRREIHEGLNVVENWNSANSFIFFGKGGEVATNRLEEQELSVLSLHLLQICLVYVNTLMMQRVLADPSWSRTLTTEDRRAITPLIYGHINPYGIFDLDMSKRLDLDFKVLT
ncbi:Tn3 family transposase [Kordiimonas lipolytica]|uniref:Tn3 family transposase n=1 Tax=Kordiimonas lipolytica TaxID=1662421 RepID=A0ABV8UBK6_9PROT|nr:Tn3 family transposase [Kordiimonas lipolytica]